MEEKDMALGDGPARAADSAGTAAAFARLYETIRRLRGPGGCPWDIEQTPESMRGDLVEEVYEAVEAINDRDPDHVAEELGDVMLNATMIAYMHEQAGQFSVADALDGVSDKLIRRHPHVFGETAGFAGPGSAARTDTAEKVLAQWDVIKRGVEGRAAESVLDEVPRGMPTLERAAKLQKKAAKSGFDWSSLDDVWPKVDEELAELREAVRDGDRAAIEGEVGDLLFAIVNVSRHLKVDPGLALARTNSKFTERFRHVERSMRKAGIPMDKDHLREMDLFWDEAKRNEGAR